MGTAKLKVKSGKQDEQIHKLTDKQNIEKENITTKISVFTGMKPKGLNESNRTYSAIGRKNIVFF